MKLRSLFIFASLALSACGPAKSPTTSLSDLADPVARAFREEATGNDVKATRLYLEALEKAAKAKNDPVQTEAVLASLDALVFRNVSAFNDMTYDSALAFRQTEVDVSRELSRIFGKADGPFAKGLIAEAVERIARHKGDGELANRFHAARGCVRDSLVFGPIAASGIETVGQSSGLEKAEAPIPESLSTPLPFSPRAPGYRTTSRGCSIALYGASAALGVREIVVDIDVPSDQTIGVSLSASSEARLTTGGSTLLHRPHRLGNAGVTRFARIKAKKGFLRVVARVAMDAEQETIELGAWDEHGDPLRAKAPAIGSVATSSGTPVGSPLSNLGRLVREEDRLMVALAWLATGEERLTEDALYSEFTSSTPSPSLLLAYARALDSSRDLSKAQMGERKRSAYDRVLSTWPNAWEAIVEHAVAAGERRASSEARIEALSDLAERRRKAKGALPSTIDLFEAATAYAEGLNDVSRLAYAKAEKSGEKSPLFYDVGRLVVNRSGPDYLNYACAAHQNKDAVHCHDALFMQGKWSAAEKEIERLRALRSSPNEFLARSAMSAIEEVDHARADAFVAKMFPGERALWLLGAKPSIDKNVVLDRAKTSPDSPWAIPPLLRAAGDDPAAPFAGLAEKITAQDRKTPIMPSAATAVLVHRERYELNANGLLHYVLFDVRRVSGTTDVDQNAQADAPDLLGRESIRIVRKRIFKKDGRILSPDRAPNAAQGHADLAQLEAGDSVEAIYEGWALPTAAGTIGFDTSDALPARTGVHDFELSISLPKNVKGSFHAHPLLGTPTTTEAGGMATSVYKWADQPVRRIEDGTPKMDAAVGVSFSTATWAEFGRGIRDAKVAMDDAAPEVSRWAKDAVSAETAKKGERAIVEALVRAAGESVKESSTGELIDVESGLPSQTARGSLASHEGSRTWLLARTLREFGIASEIVIAENDPFSADPNFPPHFGRFLHPLLVAHVMTADKKREDVWIDADIAGPPLPPGRISPELRGRNAIHENGSIAPLPAFDAGEEKDEIDLRITVDERGDAKGQVTVLLRGRSAQTLSGVLERIVGEERQRVLRGVALAWVPFANVDTVQLSSSEGSWQVAIRAELSVPGFAQVEGTKVRSWVVQGVDPIHAVFPRPFVATLGATYASKKGRESALAVNEASQYHLRRRIALPKGSTLSKLPGPFDVDSPLLRASRKIAVNGETIEEDFSLTLSTGTIAKEAYGAFTDSAHRVDDAFLASMRILPPAAK